MAARRKGSGKWQVERERCHIDNARPPATSPAKAVSVSGVVPVIMKKLGLDDMHWGQLLEEQWVDLVGAAVAKHTRPGAVNNGVLTIFVDSSVWLSELSRYGKKKMLANFKEQFGPGKIKKVGFKLDPDL